MEVKKGGLTFDWNNHWAQVPADITLGYTHGVVVDKQGLVHIFNQSPHAVLTFEPDGKFVSAWDEFPSDRFLGAHGMTLVEEDGQELLWLTDQKSCEVVKTTLSGETVLSIARPQSYDPDQGYSPTWVAQAPDGRIYVADGYGSSWVSVYDKAGKFLSSFNGSEGGGKFACPHGVWIGVREAATGLTEPVLYVTDRGNSRVQVYDLDANFIKSYYQDHPCCFSQGPGGLMLVPDLYAFINIYDENDDLVVGQLCSNQHAVARKPGWPNVPHEQRVEGKFNSPHGGTFDADRNIYIVEWIEDGRITKLSKK